MKPINILLFVLLFSATRLFGQQKIELRNCLDSAVLHYPTYKQGAIFDKELGNKIASIKNTNLPQAEINGRASYQNEVVSLPISLPGISIPEVSKDQYKISIDITQSIYKGGLTSKQIQYEEISSQINKQQSFIELYSLKQRVASLYFQVVLNQKLFETAENLQKTLNIRLKEMDAAVLNGIVLRSAKSVLMAEIAKLEQQKTELYFDLQKLFQQLNLLCGFTVNDLLFAIPDFALTQVGTQARAEFDLLNSQQLKLEHTKALIGVKNIPTIYAFSTLGYGRPGYNMLNNDFAGFAMVGVGLKWNAWNWQESKHEKERLDFTSNIIETRKEGFLMEIKLATDQQLSEIQKQVELIKLDEQIILLKEDVAKSSLVQMMNGTITTSQYVDDLNKVSLAKIDAEMHKIKQSMAIVNYYWIMGKL